MITCGNHPNREADYHCARCQAAFCKDCINEKHYGRAKTPICPLCNEPVTDLSPYREVPPIWTRIPQAITWPLQEDGYVTLLAWGIFAVVFLGAARFAITVGGLFGVIGFLLCMLFYTGFLISYFFRIIDLGARGDITVPDFTEYRGIWQSFVVPIWQYYIAHIFIFLPLTLYFGGALLFYLRGLEDIITFFSSGVTAIVLLVGTIYGLVLWPMGMLIVGVVGTVFPVMNPVFVIRQVLKIPAAYFITLGIFVLFLIIYLVVAVILAIISASLPGLSIIFGAVRAFIDGVFQLYLYMVIGHILGYLAFQERFKLKWWKENQEKPAFMIGGRAQYMSASRAPAYAPSGPVGGGGSVAGSMGAAAVAGAGAAAGAAASWGGNSQQSFGGGASPPQEETYSSVQDNLELSRRIADGNAMIDHGRHQEAEILFKEILDEDPNNTGALRGITAALVKQKNYPAAAEYAKKQASLLLKDKAYEAAWEVYSEMGKNVKDYSLEPRDQLALAKWLNEQQMYMESARALRSLAVRNPDDPLAPKALYQCGELLWKKCDKKENALQVYQYLLKKYPDIQFADHVNQAIKELQS